MINTLIEDLSTDGRGVAHSGGTVYFVPRALPGDRVELELHPETSPPSAIVLTMLETSPNRVAHPCSHAEECQGSLWGSLDYGQQIEHKCSLVERTFRKAVRAMNVLPTVASPLQWRYRNRITLNVWRGEEQIEIGFHTEARQLTGFPVHTCHLASATISECLQRLSTLIAVSGGIATPRRIQIHDTAAGAGMLLTFTDPVSADVTRQWSEKIGSIAPGGLWFAEATDAGVILDSQTISHSENALPMRTNWLGHNVDVNPAAFCQANSAAANLVGERLVRFGAENNYSNVWDLYGGFGALGFAAANAQRTVTVFELSRLSQQTMHTLAESMNIHNARFIPGDLLKTFPMHVSRITDRDVVIVDPPRSGVHREVIRLINQSKARLLVYLSCNPARLGRDMALLSLSGFRAVELQPYDFFPQTPATEVLAIFHRS